MKRLFFVLFFLMAASIVVQAQSEEGIKIRVVEEQEPSEEHDFTYTTIYKASPYDGEIPDYVFLFDNNSSKIKANKGLDSVVDDWIRKAPSPMIYIEPGAAIWTLRITVDLIGRCLPDESPSVAESRAKAVQQNIMSLLRKKNMNLNVVFDISTTGVNYDNLISEISSSSIADKDRIVSQILNSTDKESTINNLFMLYPEIGEILKRQRRVEVFGSGGWSFEFVNE